MFFIIIFFLNRKMFKVLLRKEFFNLLLEIFMLLRVNRFCRDYRILGNYYMEVVVYLF